MTQWKVNIEDLAINIFNLSLLNMTVVTASNAHLTSEIEIGV